eukprot:TRINITY_DN3379_c0_g3_i2.p1 TRINITY_DN3379_c0_g3~~TRINITY_DN3379_c0_g3_i2.p1  ORF type:complete len:269 (-),score=75.21 TRINITY_DN3379_c0_g3_i2:273-1025(-)
MSAGKKVYGRALYDYEAAYDDEIQFKFNERIVILEQEGSGWWKGEARGKVGIFPYNYVQVLELTDAELSLEQNSPGNHDDGSEDYFYSKGVSLSSLPSYAPGNLANYASRSDDEEGGAVDFVSLEELPQEKGSPRGELPPDPSPVNDVILREGQLVKKGHVRRNWKARWIRLRPGTISYYKNKEDRKPKGSIVLTPHSEINSGSRQGSAEKKYCFYVTTNQKPFVYYFAAASSIEMESWIADIRRAKPVK